MVIPSVPMEQGAITDAELPLVIYGAGGHGKVVLDIARRAGVQVHFLIDDAASTTVVNGMEVSKSLPLDWGARQRFGFLVAIGDNEIRRRLFRTDESRPLTVRYGVHEHLERFRREAAQAGEADRSAISRPNMTRKCDG